MEASLAREGSRRAVKGRRLTERGKILIAMEFFGTDIRRFFQRATGFGPLARALRVTAQ